MINIQGKDGCFFVQCKAFQWFHYSAVAYFEFLAGNVPSRALIPRRSSSLVTNRSPFFKTRRTTSRNEGPCTFHVRVLNSNHTSRCFREAFDGLAKTGPGTYVVELCSSLGRYDLENYCRVAITDRID